MDNRDKLTICACGKNEDVYLEEWMTYHFNIGIDRIIYYDNNDDDRLLRLDFIQRFINEGMLTHIPYYGKKCFQMRVYDSVIATHDFKWCAFIDCDEFITLNGKLYNNLKEFFEDYEIFNCNVLYVNWMMMTANHQEKYSPEPVIERFTEIKMPINAYDTLNVPGGNYHIKSFVRNDAHCVFNGNPHAVISTDKSCVFGMPSGYIYPTMVGSPWQPIDYSKIYIRHYYCKSREEYMLKLKKGYADSLAVPVDYFENFQNH